MGALRVLALVVLLIVPGAVAQTSEDPLAFQDPIAETTSQAEEQTGQDLSSEEIEIVLEIDVVNAEFDMVGILFGGGKIQTDIVADATLAFHAANVSRAEQALAQQMGDENATLQETTGLETNQTVITAEAIRTAGGGLLLEAFQNVQEEAAERYVEDALPQVAVLSTAFTWHNTEPGEGVDEEEQDVDPRNPPIVLDASMTLRFLDRVALGDFITSQGNEEPENASMVLQDGLQDSDEKTVEEKIRENHTAPFLQQDAFQVLGIDQLLDIDLPPGWRMNLTMTVPDGFTVEGASDALDVNDDRQTVTYYADGSQRDERFATSGMVTLSSRSLVAMTLVLLVGVTGFLTRYPAEMVVFALHERFS